MNSNTTLTSLRELSGEELEQLFRENPAGNPAPIPGLYRGRFLTGIANGATAANLWFRLYPRLFFDPVPYGIEFGSGGGRWWFGRPELQAGDFRLVNGPSRWRPGFQTNQLVYDIMPMPKFIRNIFYDEVVVLGEDLILGMGGLNAGPDEGDHFFFQLRRMPG